MNRWIGVFYFTTKVGSGCSLMTNLNNNIVLVLGNMLPNDMFIFNVYVYVF